MHRFPFPRAVDRGFILVLAVAIVARAIAIVQARQAPFWSTPIMDESAYMRLADAMVKGHAPPHGAYYQAPGYGYFLAAIHALEGSVVLVKLVQMTMGVINSVLVWALTRRYFGAREAALAGVLWAVYPIALFHEVLLLKPTLAVLMSLLALVTMPESLSSDPLARRGAILRCAASGLFLGFASVTQAEIAGVSLLLAVIAAAGWFQRPPAPRGKRRASGARPARPTTPKIAWSIGAAAFLFMLAIPTVENAARRGGFVIVAFGGGTNFFIGNNPNANGSYVPLRLSRSDPVFEESDAVELAVDAVGHPLRPAEVSRYWWKRGLTWWWEHPLAALRLSVKKLALLWGPQEQADVIDSGIAARWMAILRNPIVHPRILLPVALVGLWMTLRRRALWGPRTFILGSTIMIVPFFVFERFRMPMTAVCLPFVAHAAVRLWDALWARRLVPAAAGVIAAAAIALTLSFAHVTRERTVMRANVGNMFLLRGRYEEAVTEYEAVLAARPADARVEIGLAMAQARLGRADSALRTLDSVLGKLRAEARATGKMPSRELVICYALAGDLELEAGRPLQAAEHYRDALNLEPGHPELTSKLGKAEAAARPAGSRGHDFGAPRPSPGTR